MELTDEMKKKCLCPTCGTYRLHKMNGCAFCATGPVHKDVDVTISPCECQSCPVRREGNFKIILCCFEENEREAYFGSPKMEANISVIDVTAEIPQVGSVVVDLSEEGE